MNERISALAERFQSLGCRDPEAWARSEIEEDVAQFARFVLLNTLWRSVVPVGDRRALNRFAGPNDDGRGGALRRIKDAGVDLDDLLVLVRSAQADVVRAFASTLDMDCDLPPQATGVRWGLFELDAECRPTRPITGLHESVDDTAPRDPLPTTGSA